MFIWSVKLNRNFIWGFFAVICLSIGVIAFFAPKDSSDVLQNSVNFTAKTYEQQVGIIESFGYKVEPQPILIEEIIIPAEFDEKYEKYNDFQKLSGFDLSDYKGSRVKKYTYRVKNYSDGDENVIANIFVYGNKAIGGDISSAKVDGFLHGFIKE